MSDPKSPPLEDWMNFPPIGWRLRDAWETRVALWRKRSRKERRTEASRKSMRLLADPRPTLLFKLDYKEALYWSRGDCMTADMEAHRLPKKLQQGFWLISIGGGPESRRFIPNIGEWIESRHAKKVIQASMMIERAHAERAEIESAINLHVSAIDRLAGLV